MRPRSGAVQFRRAYSAEAPNFSHGRFHRPQPILTCARVQRPEHNTELKHFPFSNFRYFLTLFSKFFASFPHGTCSLSVSRQYLALDGIYHLLRAAFPNNPTPRLRLVMPLKPSSTGFSPSLTPFSKGLEAGS